MDNISMLMSFSLTRQEAVIYTELLSGDKMTGYEVAKRTGISRSNVYTALAGLVEKGAADEMKGDPTYYTALPVESFCDNKLHALKGLRDELIKSLVCEKTTADGYITVTGERIPERLRNIINAAAVRVYISAPGYVFDALSDELNDAVGRGLRIVAISAHTPNIVGAQNYASGKESAQIRLIADNTAALTGDYIPGDDACSCMYSGRGSLQSLIKDALKNELRSISG